MQRSFWQTIRQTDEFRSIPLRALEIFAERWICSNDIVYSKTYRIWERRFFCSQHIMCTNAHINPNPYKSCQNPWYQNDTVGFTYISSFYSIQICWLALPPQATGKFLLLNITRNDYKFILPSCFRIATTTLNFYENLDIFLEIDHIHMHLIHHVASLHVRNVYTNS